MKGQITITFSAKEAVAILSNETLPKSITNKVVKAFREANVTPQGAKASITSRVKKTAARASRVSSDAVATQ